MQNLWTTGIPSPCSGKAFPSVAWGTFKNEVVQPEPSLWIVYISEHGSHNQIWICIHAGHVTCVHWWHTYTMMTSAGACMQATGGFHFCFQGIYFRMNICQSLRKRWDPRTQKSKVLIRKKAVLESEIPTVQSDITETYICRILSIRFLKYIPSAWYESRFVFHDWDIKFWPIATWGEKSSFGLHFSVTVHPWGKSGQETMQELGGRNWSRGHSGCCSLASSPWLAQPAFSPNPGPLAKGDTNHCKLGLHYQSLIRSSYRQISHCSEFRVWGGITGEGLINNALEIHGKYADSHIVKDSLLNWEELVVIKISV